jgi:hypothetical protein
MMSIGMSVFLAVREYLFLKANPARGDFGGLANLGSYVVGVLIPSMVAVLTMLAVICLIILRPTKGKLTN